MYDMRLLIFELHPPALEQEGLVAALRVRLAAVEARAGLQAELEIEGERWLPIAIEQELYRIAQEALNNVTKMPRRSG
jgi:signal transduction histidine kinase